MISSGRAVLLQVTLLHCVVQAQANGGLNHFADGFRAAEKLRTLHPEYFRLLTTTPVDFFDVSTDFSPYDYSAAHPIIK